MSEGIPYADIVILALIAGFILLRLRNALGQKGGEDDSGFLQRRQLPPQSQEPVVQLVDKSLKPRIREEADTYLAGLSDRVMIDTLVAIRARDSQFSATRFLDGGRMAFEMVMEAFNKGDKQSLKMLMSDELFKDFAAEVDKREKEESKSETTLVSVQAKEILHAQLIGNMARIKVKFVSEQITVVRDKEGKIIEGDVSEIHHLEDEWLFERDVTSKNPNWKIIET